MIGIRSACYQLNQKTINGKRDALTIATFFRYQF